MPTIMTHRRFGVELEGFIDNASYGGKRVGGNDWDIDSDGSLRTDRELDAIEAKSGPLYDTSYIYSFYDWLQSKDWHVNNSAGLHIHVEVEDYTFADWQKLLALMLGIEPYIFCVTDRYRSGSSYCRQLHRRPNSIRNVLNRTPNDSDSQYSARFADDNRYYGLNFEAHHSYRKTVEFRYFAPQEEAKHVEAYIELVTKIVDFAKHATLDQVLVIASKILESDFREAREMIHEVLQLECAENLIVDSSSFWDEYPRGDMNQILTDVCDTHHVNVAI